MKIRTDFLNSPAAAQFTGNAAANTMSNFASLLQQQSRAPALAPPPPAVMAAPPKAAPEATSADRNTENNSSSESTEAADEAAPDESANKPRPANKPRARQADAQAPARATREEASPARSEKSAVAADDTSATPADQKTQGDSTTPTWLAGWMAPPATTAPTTAVAQRSTGLAEVADGSETLPGDADAAGNAVGATRGRGVPAGARKTDAREGFDAAKAAEAADGGIASNSKEPANALPGFAAVLAEQRHTEAGPHRDAATPSVDGARGALASSAPATGSVTQDAASTSNAHVRAAVGSPEFPQELGVQLSVLARDGIQKAELHLNPTEMGPVSVQIVMDGTQARVDFGADVAATRQAIEAGLPELASALRDAGFTLAGGGVSQHAGGRQGSEGSDGDQARRDGGATRAGVGGVEGSDATSRVVRTRVSAGGVDVYA